MPPRVNLSAAVLAHLGLVIGTHDFHVLRRRNTDFKTLLFHDRVVDEHLFEPVLPGHFWLTRAEAHLVLHHIPYRKSLHGDLLFVNVTVDGRGARDFARHVLNVVGRSLDDAALGFAHAHVVDVDHFAGAAVRKTENGERLH